MNNSTNFNNTLLSDSNLSSIENNYNWFEVLIIYKALLLSFIVVILIYWLRFECQIGKQIAQSIVEQKFNQVFEPPQLKVRHEYAPVSIINSDQQPTRRRNDRTDTQV